MATNRICRRKCTLFRVKNRTNNRVYCYVPTTEHRGRLLVLYDESDTEWEMYSRAYDARTLESNLNRGSWVRYEENVPTIPKGTEAQ